MSTLVDVSELRLVLCPEPEGVPPTISVERLLDAAVYTTAVSRNAQLVAARNKPCLIHHRDVTVRIGADGSAHKQERGA